MQYGGVSAGNSALCGPTVSGKLSLGGDQKLPWWQVTWQLIPVKAATTPQLKGICHSQ